ncbi:MAG: arginine--tRNA ligase [Parvularculales bacterium]
MNVFAVFENYLYEGLDSLVKDGVLPENLDYTRITVEPPRNPDHGDIATNVAMVLAKPAGLKPRHIAEALVEGLKGREMIAGIEIAGPGFLNIRLSETSLRDIAGYVLKANRRFAANSFGAGHKVNVEYVSANPTGPLHIGHTRGAIFGDALANLLAWTGHEVCREYYINDAGGQIDTLTQSVWLRYREALGEDIDSMPEDSYPGDYLKPVGAALADQYKDTLLSKPEDEWQSVVRDAAVEAMMALIKEDMATLGVHHEVFSSERSMIGDGKLEAAIGILQEKGLLYRGILKPPKGRESDEESGEECAPEPQLLFRSTQFGDDRDRAVQRSNGLFTYFASDIAYHLDKFRRGYCNMIGVWGADHSGYIKRLQAMVTAITDGEGAAEIRICQLVRFLRDAQPVKMSKRAGEFVSVRDIVNEVGGDAVRFMMLYRRNDAPLDFDFEKVKEQSRDNPIFYVQYAHARICSVLRVAVEPENGLTLQEIEPEVLAGADFKQISDELEMALLRQVAAFPRLIASSAMTREPHRVAFYLYELASTFHALWNKGRDDSALRFIRQDNKPLTLARLGLITTVAFILAEGLEILGITPAREM